MNTRQWLAAAGILTTCGIAATGLSAADPTPGVAPDAIDTLILPIDQARPRMDHTTVGQAPSPSTDAPNAADPCYVDALQPDAAELFGTGLQAFRDVRYTGSGNVMITQAIGVYPDAAAAAAVVARFTEGLSACRATAPAGLNVGNLGAAGAAWSGSVCGDELRAVRNVVIRVQACHMNNPAGEAASVADAIRAKVNGAA